MYYESLLLILCGTIIILNNIQLYFMSNRDEDQKAKINKLKKEIKRLEETKPQQIASSNDSEVYSTAG